MILIFITAIVVLLLSFACYLFVFYSPKPRKDAAKRKPFGNQYAKYWNRILKHICELEKMPCERVWITSHDGKKLFGRLYEIKKNAPIVLCFHGYRSFGLRDFCTSVSCFGEMGFNVLVVDERAQGESEGHTITMGLKEERDCEEWIRYVISRFGTDCHIALAGVSMGGSVVLMASGAELPDNVKCILADSPYSSAKEQFESLLHAFKLPAKLFYAFISMSARLWVGLKLSDCDVRYSIAKTHLPILVIHGLEDRFVSSAMSRKLHDEYPDKFQLELFENAGHALSYFEDEDRYKRIIGEFLKNNFEE